MIQQNYTHDSISSWKRIGIFIIDSLISFIVYVLLLFTIGNLIIKNVAKEDINLANQEYLTICQNNNLPVVKDSQYGLYQIDFDLLMDEYVQSGLTSEKAYEKYIETDNNIQSLLKENEAYVNSYSSFYFTYLFSSIITMLVSLFVFQFIIPLLNKKHQTIGMKIFKGAITNKKDGTIISSIQVLLRFGLIFITEYLLVYMLLDWFGLIFLILVTLFLISMSKSKFTIHDLILKTKINKEEYTYTE